MFLIKFYPTVLFQAAVEGRTSTFYLLDSSSSKEFAVYWNAGNASAVTARLFLSKE